MIMVDSIRRIEWTNAFKKDYRREKKKRSDLDELLSPVLYKLMNDEQLEERYCDHALIGDKFGFRDCHIKPDLLLLYHKQYENVLTLLRLGSHSQLF